MSETSHPDLARLRIDRDAAPGRRWVPWVVLLGLALVAAAVYPSAREYVAGRNATEVEVAHAVQVAAAGTDRPGALPVLVATGYVIARHSSDVGVKMGGRIASLRFEEGTKVRRGEVMAVIEHADLDAQLEAARRAVGEAQAALGQTTAARDEDARNLERQRALMKDGITTTAALTAAESAAAVSAARVTSAEAAIASAKARVDVTQAAIENANVRAPFDGVVINKRAEVGETVSPFGVQGQATREGGAIATIADLRELEVQTEVNENNVAKLQPGMPAEVKLQAYQDTPFRGRLREIFPSADRSKSIVEVRVSILNPDARVKPEMTASVTFEEPGRAAAADAAPGAAAPSTVLVPKTAIAERGGRPVVWVVTGVTAVQRGVVVGPERLDRIEVRSGLAPGEAVVLAPAPGLGERVRVKVR